MRTSRWLTTLVLLFGFAAPASADVGVLGPLGERTRDSSPGSFATLPDGTVLFVADDGVHGNELWRTDGTAAGTAMVVELTAGPEGWGPSPPTVVNGVAYFANNGTEYWRTDGTAAGTRRFATVPDVEWAHEPRFEPWGDKVVFGSEESALRVTDGTPAGTRTLDLFPGRPAVGAEHWHVAGGYLYFFNDSEHTLYRTDGTAAGTVVIENIRGVGALLDVEGQLVATAGGGGLWAVAPGATTATLIEEHANGVQRALDGLVYFGSMQGLESWAPSKGRTLIADATPRAKYAIVGGEEEIARSGDRLFYAGSIDGPTRLYTVGPDGAKAIGANLVDPVDFVPLPDGRVLFNGADRRWDPARQALWISDGTEAGTRPVTRQYAYVGTPVAVASRGVVGYDETLATGRELHRFDPTFEHYDLLVDINRRTVGSDPAEAARVGDRVVFKTNEQLALWATDGTTAGTTRLLERDSGGLPLDPFGIASDDDLALFAARDGIYRTDGTRPGTGRIADIGVDPESFTALARVGTTSVFTARKQDEDSDDLWRTDGTAAGTQRLTTGAHMAYAQVALSGAGTMLVSGYRGGFFATDGTAPGTRRLFADYTPWYAPDLIAVDDGFLASAGSPATGEELWHVDADGRNPRLVKEFVPGTQSSWPAAFGRVGDRMLFAASGGGPYWTWQTMDLATERIEPMTWVQGGALEPPETAGGVTYLTSFTDGRTYLYRTDGTQAGTRLLQTFDGDYSDVAVGFTHLDGVTYFTAEDEAHGFELWQTDGTPEGTRLAHDFRPGPQSSYPGNLVATEDFLFLTADDDAYGPEPFVIRAAPRPTKEPDAPPVTVTPLPIPGTIAPPKRLDPTAAPRSRAKVTVRAHRLRAVRGAQRWRVTGIVNANPCDGRVQVLLGRRTRVLKRVTTPLRDCAFSATVSTTSRSSGRWLQVRTVPSTTLADGTSRRIRVGR